MHGVDCPLTAAYMDATTLYKGMPSPVVHKNAICVFEADQSEFKSVVWTGAVRRGGCHVRLAPADERAGR